MDFFDAQEDALRLSRRLLFAFALAVVGMIGVVYLTVLVLFGLAGLGGPAGVAGGAAWFQPGILAVVAVGMGAVIATGSAVRTAQLRRGGPAVAELLGGRPVPPDSSDPLERRLLNVVEEMSIASGTPVPAVYLLEREPGINAFAAGHSIHDAAVAVTRGALEALDRDELQGVMAHEFSHILNGDMRLNLRLIGLLFGILLLTVGGRGLLRGTGRGRGGGRTGGQLAILGLVLVLLGYLGVFFGRMMQSAVSRQREFLADAAAVQFTRNPDGIAGALRKIGAGSGSQIRDHHAVEAGHLFFASGLRGGLSRLMSTHPPLGERIRRIDPAWDGRFEAGPGGSAPVHFAPAAAPAATGLPEATARGEGRTDPPTGSPAFLAGAAALSPESVAGARSFLAALPAPLREAARTPEGAIPLALAVILSDSPAVRERQLGEIATALGPDMAGTSRRYAEQMGVLEEEARLSLLDLGLPALRALPLERARHLFEAADQAIRADGRVDPFEYAVFHILSRNLRPPAEGAERAGGAPRGGNHPLRRLEEEALVLLSAIAWAGAEGKVEEAQTALRAGGSVLPGSSSDAWQLLAKEEVGVERVEAALDRLHRASPEGLRSLLEAAERIASWDGRWTSSERAMLRAIAEALGIPIAPRVRS